MNACFKFWTLLCFGILFIIGCRPSGSEVDRYLNTYEAVVVEWEEKAKYGHISMDDVQELNALNMKFAQKAEKLKTTSEWSDSQFDRYVDLSMRLSNVFMEMSERPPSFNY